MHQTAKQGIGVQEVVLTELHHRFYNSLQVISSLAGGLMRSDLQPADQRRAAAELQQRVAVIGGLHRLLAQPQGGDLKPVCDDLCRTLASAFAREDARISVSVRCTATDASTARGLLLMVAELVTNAMKHTLPEFPLSIDVDLTGRIEAYELKVISAGVGRGAAPPGRPRVASELAELFGGSLAVETDRPYAVRVSLPRSCA